MNKYQEIDYKSQQATWEYFGNAYRNTPSFVKEDSFRPKMDPAKLWPAGVPWNVAETSYRN